MLWPEDRNHWNNLPYPLRPCPEEVEVFRRHLLPGKTLLLGSTYELLGLCDAAIDLSPRYDDPKISKGDWHHFEGHYANIIGDGSLNWGADDLLRYLETKCERLIVRVFSEKLPGMKYATHFYRELPMATEVAQISKSCPIFIWTFST